jgi:hypothetical protein
VCVFALALPLSATVLALGLVVSFPIVGSVWVPSLAQLAATTERSGLQPGVALGLFNICWAISQIVGAVGGARLSRFGEAVPFLILGALCLLGTRAAGRLPATGEGELELCSE